MHDESLQGLVNVRIMDILIEIFGDPRELRYQTKGVHDQRLSVFYSKKLVLVDHPETVALDKLLSELLGTFRRENQSRNEGNPNRNILIFHVL